MLYKSKLFFLSIKSVLLFLILLTVEPSHAQLWSGMSDPLGYVSTHLPQMGNKAPSDLGSLWGWSPFSFAPSFRGELKASAMLVSLERGKFSNANSGVSLDFIKDLAFEKQGFLVETMARTQLSRFALRLHYEAYTKNLSGTRGSLQWPQWRVGGDLDLMDSGGLRFGLNIDSVWTQPTFSYSLPIAGNDLIVWPRPVTVGFHASYNPSDFESITPSVEIRYRHPAVTGSLVKELEIAIGAKTPRSSRGTSGLRAGWRYTSMEYDVADRFIDVTWSSFFAEYVCFF
ncbi:MAG: hypothetical protein HY912_15910 [Desulfomonile tiedjei]|uniref:Uncharacterized protein n=1 Tax=Desulfomonile tiedjei TaxID=2358 RepID=A0A9D6V524_9BACT|nr:hypothetical protein [Desulfomonile tiedjei]